MFSVTDKTEQLSFLSEMNRINSLPSSEPVKFINLLKEHFDIKAFIPQSFYRTYESSSTNYREYSLESVVSALLLCHFFNISSMPILILLLSFSPDIRDFCHFENSKIPSESVFSKFKTTFDKELLALFDNMSMHVMNIFTSFNNGLPDDSPLKGLNETLIYDTTGLKPKVKENNPKMVASEIKRQSAYKKFSGKEDFNPYAAAYNSLPKFASVNPSIRLDYANGHFGYFYKFGMVTNGFGIPLHIHFLDEDFYKYLPESYSSMEEQKFAFDNASLKPVLSTFFPKIGENRFTTFMGDSEFDSYDNYNFLSSMDFKKVLINLNNRNFKPDTAVKFPLNPENVPTCPNDPYLPFISDGSVKGKDRSFRFKFVCPKSKRVKGKWTCECPNKCRETKSTVTTYVYPNGDLRDYFGVLRGSVEWDKLYKKRTIIERKFSSIKSHPSIAQPKTTNCASMRSDVFLNVTAKLIIVILAFALGNTQYISNLRKLLRFSA